VNRSLIFCVFAAFCLASSVGCDGMFDPEDSGKGQGVQDTPCDPLAGNCNDDVVDPFTPLPMPSVGCDPAAHVTTAVIRPFVEPTVCSGALEFAEPGDSTFACGPAGACLPDESSAGGFVRAGRRCAGGDCPAGSHCDELTGRCSSHCLLGVKACPNEGETCDCFGRCSDPVVAARKFELTVDPPLIEVLLPHESAQDDPLVNSAVWRRQVAVTLSTQNPANPCDDGDACTTGVCTLGSGCSYTQDETLPGCCLGVVSGDLPPQLPEGETAVFTESWEQNCGPAWEGAGNSAEAGEPEYVSDPAWAHCSGSGSLVASLGKGDAPRRSSWFEPIAIKPSTDYCLTAGFKAAAGVSPALSVVEYDSKARFIGEKSVVQAPPPSTSQSKWQYLFAPFKSANRAVEMRVQMAVTSEPNAPASSRVLLDDIRITEGPCPQPS